MGKTVIEGARAVVDRQAKGGSAPRLLPEHEDLIRASAISPEVAAARGYRSVTKKSELEELGFGRQQRRVPALLIPVWNVVGEVRLYQSRPNAPRIVDGKSVKYETPGKAHMVLDVPPPVRPWLKDPARPLFVTEGSRKADSAASQGLCCVAVLGVWNWRGTNDHGGKAVLPDWDEIALNGRQVYICYDSDVMLKPEVHQAMARLRDVLQNRKGHVAFIYLPPGEGGSKVGLDDYLADGGSVDELMKLATLFERVPIQVADTAGHPYEETPAGIVRYKSLDDCDLPIPLTNFTARIISEVTQDDGDEVHLSFEIETKLKGRIRKVQVPACKFANLFWVTEVLGAEAIVFPGQSCRDHTRVAIQQLSESIHHRTVFTHTGWRLIDDLWLYLHAGGAIGADGSHSEVEVSLSSQGDRLQLLELPAPPEGEDARAAINTCLRFLDLGPGRITFPLLSAVWRSIFPNCDFTSHLSGASGGGKTALATLCQQFWGKGVTARSLPGDWSSTGNSLEVLSFTTKDMLLVVDDFSPTGSATDVQRKHREADRFIRAQGNRSGRRRLRPDGSMRATKYPRGSTLSTGEDVPRGQSLQARMFIIDVPEGLLVERLEAFACCQADAAEGIFASAMAGFVCWMAGRHDDAVGEFSAETKRLSKHAHESKGHLRTPRIVAELAAGFSAFISFAVETGAISEVVAGELKARCWEGLLEAAAAQGQYQKASEPAGRFVKLVASALVSGQAHVASMDGTEPNQPQAWGWRRGRGELGPLGPRIGWIEGDDLYLDALTAFSVAQRLGRDTGDAIEVTLTTLRRRLRERGYLASIDVRGGKNRLEVRRMVEGARRSLLHLPASVLSPPESGPSGPSEDGGSQSDPEPLAPEGDSEQPLGHQMGHSVEEVAQESGPEPGGGVAEGTEGPPGPPSEHTEVDSDMGADTHSGPGTDDEWEEGTL